MRLDKIKFATLVAYIGSLRPEHDIDLYSLDKLTDVDLPQQEPYRADAAAVNDLLKHINREGGFIEAIRAYRVLTGAGLKESKDAVEKYRNVKPIGKD